MANENSAEAVRGTEKQELPEAVAADTLGLGISPERWLHMKLVEKRWLVEKKAAIRRCDIETSLHYQTAASAVCADTRNQPNR